MEDDRYGLPDLRRLMSTGPHLPAISHPLEMPFSLQRNLNPGIPLPQPSTHFGSVHHHVFPNTNNQYNPPPQGVGFATGICPSSSSSAPVNPSATTTRLHSVEAECVGDRLMESGSSTSRWPRQETLTLLEIRSHLNSKFKEANHKGPLWDEVSRIMSEDYGYQRSGKKCREKFENLYKYYKKTKEGKAGRHDGKNYRFFRQLEAIYGESASLSNNRVRQASKHNWQDQNKLCECISFSISNTSHELETSSSENNEEYDLTDLAFAMGSHSMDMERKKLQHVDVNDGNANRRSRRLGLGEKVKAFIDSQMKRLMERQEAWMDNVLKTIEQREQERAWREMEWRKQETARFNREHELWAKKKAWMEARDATLIEALKKINGGHEQLIKANLSLSKEHLLPERDNDQSENINMKESETWSLIQLRTSLDSSFQGCGQASSTDGLWEVIAAKMKCLGYNLTGAECEERWESIRASFNKIEDGNRKVD